MDCFTIEAEESEFFDALEHIAQESDLVSDCSYSRNWEYDVWISAPQSVAERRREFIRWMGDLEGEIGVDSCGNGKGDLLIGDIHRIREDSGAVLRTCSSIEDEFSSSRSSMSSWNTDDLELYQGADFCDCRNGVVENDRLRGLEEVSRLSPSVQQFVDRESQGNLSKSRKTSKLKRRWLSKLRYMSCLMSGNVKEDSMGANGFGQAQGTSIRRVRVRHCRRRSKELSALFTGQDIKAHDGSITAMKFSLDGQYLASAGEDKIVRVWQVVEDERLDTIDIPDADPSCVYFSVNHLSELGPLMLEKDKRKSLRKITQDSACVVFPKKVFRILEKPLHVFEGHCGEILDLSWSKDNCLLSSSVDKTVRLWRVGVDHCLKIFQHSDYVTCVQFNPTNDDYFISGSIDGKVRIWTIGCCKVVYWAETRNIITAVSYRPDGQGGIVGSIAGTCHYFHLTDNHFQLGVQMCVTSKKKKLPCKRITGFQFLPQDPSRVLVTSADSQVRIIDGVNVIGKYKGHHRNAGNQSCAAFTKDGNHIVSASDDSNVYIWNYNEKGSKPIKSFECFSSDASVAIPWPGLKTGPNPDPSPLKSTKLHTVSTNSLPFSSSTCLSLSHDYFFDSTKGSATWPEEKLPVSSPSPISKSQYKLFKNSYHMASDSHAWGLVIVTSGWDGRIRSFHNYGLPVSL